MKCDWYPLLVLIYQVDVGPNLQSPPPFQWDWYPYKSLLKAKNLLSLRSLWNHPSPLQRWSRTHRHVHRRLQAVAGLSQQGLILIEKNVSASWWLFFLNKEVTKLSIMDTVAALRRQRMLTVQRKEQYVFIAKCLRLVSHEMKFSCHWCSIYEALLRQIICLKTYKDPY